MGEANDGAQAPLFSQRLHMLQQRYQVFLDTVTPHTIGRWAGLAVFALLYFIRVFYLRGFYIITYALGIGLLNLFISFLSPSLDPAIELEMEDTDDTAALPMKANDEFRPFIRRLPEFKFWLKSAQSFLAAFVCTFFPFLDVPVFWPILVLYFIVLFAATMRKQIRHMIKYRYIPFSFGKKSYKGREERPKK